jgi:hypothetical protein
VQYHRYVITATVNRYDIGFTILPSPNSIQGSPRDPDSQGNNTEHELIVDFRAFRQMRDIAYALMVRPDHKYLKEYDEPF